MHERDMSYAHSDLEGVVALRDRDVKGIEELVGYERDPFKDGLKLMGAIAELNKEVYMITIGVGLGMSFAFYDNFWKNTLGDSYNSRQNRTSNI